MFENDYFMRMIRDFARALAKILFNKDTVTYELPEEEEYTATDFLYLELEALLRDGKINEAENHLLEGKNELLKNRRYQELALYFYIRLNSYDDDYLDSHDYSREEIEQGIKDLSHDLGVPMDL